MIYYSVSRPTYGQIPDEFGIDMHGSFLAAKPLEAKPQLPIQGNYW